MKYLIQWKRESEENAAMKRLTIEKQIEEIKELFDKKEYHRIGSTALELIQFCESLTDLEYTIRHIDIMIDAEK